MSVDVLPSLRTKVVTIETVIMGVATNYIILHLTTKVTECETEDGLGLGSELEE